MSKTSDIEVAGRIAPWNARSLALSLLLGSHPPELPARAIVSFGELFGVASGTMRTALSRMVANGDITGGDGRYRLLGGLRERQQAQDAGRRSPGDAWDGTWHSVVAAADQRGIADRRRFRAVMANHRFGELRPDIWMRPANQPAPAPTADWIMLSGRLDGIGSADLVDRLWDLGAIADDAAVLIDRLDALWNDVDWDAPAAIPPIFTTSAAVVRFLRSEPRLPPALTPVGWIVDELRRSYDDVEAEFQRRLQAFLRAT